MPMEKTRFACIASTREQPLDKTIRPAVGPLLPGDQRAAHDDRRHFILSDPSEEDLIGPGFRVESPGAMAGHERYREGPVLRADVQGQNSGGIADPPVHFPILLHEAFTLDRVLGLVIGADETDSSSENVSHRPLIMFLDGGREGAARIVGRGKRYLARWSSQTESCRCRPEQCACNEC